MDFFAVETMPFAIALCLTGGIAVIEALGLVSGFSASSSIDNALPELDVDAPEVEAPDGAAIEMGPLSQVLSWLSFGRVPALVILILFTAAFGLAGFIEQEALRRSFGFALHPALASIPALVAAAFATRYGGRLLAHIIPRVETDAVSTKGFIGRIATVIRGVARPGMPAEAKLKDLRGKTHYLLVEPDEADQVFGAGSQVVIISEDRGVYRAITKLKPTQP